MNFVFKINLTIILAIFFNSPYLFADSELDLLCPDGRVKGEFIVQYKASSFRRDGSLRKASLRSKIAKHKVALNRHYTGIHTTETAYIKIDDTANEVESYKNLLADKEILSVTPNCKVKKLMPGISVSGKVIVAGHEEQDLPQITFAYDSIGKLGNISKNITQSTIALSELPFSPEYTEYIRSQTVISTQFGLQAFPASGNLSQLYKANFQDPINTCSLSIFDIPDNTAASERIAHFNMINLMQGESFGHCRYFNGDANGDNIPDVIIASNEDSINQAQSKVLIIGGSNSFIGKATFSQNTYHVQPADLNRDGKTELVALTQNLNSLGANSYAIESASHQGSGVYGNSLKREITERSSYQQDNPDAAMAVGDLNGDGFPDIVVIGGKSIWFMINNGQGQFPTANATYLGENVGLAYYLKSKISITDLDNDGWNDILIYWDKEFVLIRNNQGQMTHLTKFNVSDGFTGFTLADVQSDGFLDIVVTDKNSDKVNVFLSRLGQVWSQYPQVFPENPFVNTNEYQIQLTHKPTGIPLVHRQNGVYGAKIVLKNKSQPNITYSTLSESDGNFLIGGVRAGTYTITVETKGANAVFRAPTSEIVVNNTISNLVISARDDLLPINIPSISNPPAVKTNDPAANLMWGLHNVAQLNGNLDVDVDAPEAWQKTIGNKDLVVAVLDDGYDYQHPDLLNGRYINKREISENNIDDDNNGYVDDVYGVDIADKDGDPRSGNINNSHGTHVIGTINSTANNNIGVMGVAPNVKVMGVKIFGDGESSASNSDILEGFEYVIKQKRSGHNIRVINGSFGGQASCDNATKTAIQELVNVSVVPIFSAGNNNVDNDKTPMTPSGCAVDGLLSVAAVDNQGKLADFGGGNGSHYGAKTVHVAAPGKDIWSTYPLPWNGHLNTGYRAISGTSMASPHVAGVVALLLSSRPELTPKQVKEILIKSSKPLASLKGKIVSGGIVKSRAALDFKLSESGDSGQNSVSEKDKQKVKALLQVINNSIKRASKPKPKNPDLSGLTFFEQSKELNKYKKKNKARIKAIKLISNSLIELSILVNKAGGTIEKVSASALINLESLLKIARRGKGKKSKSAWDKFKQVLKNINT